MSKLIDTHFHLDYYKNHKELYAQINKLQQYTLCMTSSPGVYYSCLKLYQETKYVKFALGFHPRNEQFAQKDLKYFEKLFKIARYIGEVGLDFSSTYSNNIADQIYTFEYIVQLCAKNDKLLSVHLMKAEDDAISILKKEKPNKCIIHWFTGSKNQLEQLLELGCYFSINAEMVKSENRIQKVLMIPYNKLLIESDGPFAKINRNQYTPDKLIEIYNTVSGSIKRPNLREEIYNNFKTLLTI